MFFGHSSQIKAQVNNEIRVAGFGGGRTRFVLASSTGGPPPGFFFPTMSRLYNALKNVDYFGPSGTVSCDIAGLNTLTTYVASGSLVNTDGQLLADVFFAPAIDTVLSDEEASELARFVKKGGVLLVSGEGWGDSTPGQGFEYNLLFERLGISDYFNTERYYPGGVIQSSSPLYSSPSTNGPFGTVGPLRHAAFRVFTNSSLNKLFASNDSSGLVFESKIDNGYVAVSGTSLFVNDLIADIDNLRYFLNLFALGCKDGTKVVLNVPSFKQGLPPYDNADPLWEGNIYDHGSTERLWCDRDNGTALMYECGCALTSASMVMSYLGVEKTPLVGSAVVDLDPMSLNFSAKGLLKNGGYAGFAYGNFRWDFVSNLSQFIHNEDSTSPKIEQPVREDFSAERVKELIDAKTPVILKVSGSFGVHWVTVVGYDSSSNRLIINDPAYPDPDFGKFTYLDERYVPFTEGSMVVYTNTDSDFRYLQFVTVSQNHLLATDSLGNKTGYDPETGQHLEQIPNSSYALDEYYGSPAEVSATATTDGVRFLTLRLPPDGQYSLQVFSQDSEPHEVIVYSSSLNGNLASAILPPASHKKYNLVYSNATAGEGVVIVPDDKKIEIEVTPFVPSNVIIPHRLFPVSVALLASSDFDVNSVDKNSLKFGKTGSEDSLLGCLRMLIDTNKDHQKDLICYFNGGKTDLDTGDTSANLTGSYQGVNIFSSDFVKVIKPWPLFR